MPLGALHTAWLPHGEADKGQEVQIVVVVVEFYHHYQHFLAIIPFQTPKKIVKRKVLMRIIQFSYYSN